jgi:hypothetical protein
MPPKNLHLGKIKKAIGNFMVWLPVYNRQKTVGYEPGAECIAENEVASFEGKSV